MKIDKSVVAPLVAVAAMAVEAVSGHKVDQATQAVIVNDIVIVVSLATTIYGIFKNHVKQ
jgi:hypothetical protein